MDFEVEVMATLDFEFPDERMTLRGLTAPGAGFASGHDEQSYQCIIALSIGLSIFPFRPFGRSFSLDSLSASMLPNGHIPKYVACGRLQGSYAVRLHRSLHAYQM